MEEGFLADRSQAYFTQQKWLPGQPESRLLGGLKVDREETIPVITLRCPKCGYLESYANGRADAFG